MNSDDQTVQPFDANQGSVSSRPAETNENLHEKLRQLREDTTQKEKLIENGDQYIRRLQSFSKDSSVGRAVHKAWKEEQGAYTENAECRDSLWGSHPCVRYRISSERDRSVRVKEEAEITGKIRAWAKELESGTKSENWDQVGEELTESLRERLGVLQEKNRQLDVRWRVLVEKQLETVHPDCTDISVCDAFAAEYDEVSGCEESTDDQSDE